MEEKLFLFLKLDHFFVKSIFSPLKIPKNFSKNDKTAFRQAQMPDFATTCAMTAATRKILSATRTILALTWFLDH